MLLIRSHVTYCKFKYILFYWILIFGLFNTILSKPMDPDQIQINSRLSSSESSSSSSSSFSSLSSSSSSASLSSSSSSSSSLFDSSAFQPSDNTVNSDKSIISHQLKVIMDFKSRLVSQLKLPHFNNPNSKSSRNVYNSTKANKNINLSSDLRRIINNQMTSASKESDSSKIKIDIIRFQKTSSCNVNEVEECYKVVLPISNYDVSDYITNERIVSAKLLLPSPFNNDVESHTLPSNKESVLVTQNGSQPIQVSLINPLSRDKEIDITEVVRHILDDTNKQQINTNHKSSNRRLFSSNSLNNMDSILKVSLQPNQSIDINKTDFKFSNFVDTDNIILQLHIRTLPQLKRRKRGITNYCQPGQYFCCTHKLTVTLEDLKLDRYVIAPKYFLLNYCGGECNNYMKLTSNNAYGLHLVNNRRNVPLSEKKKLRPCCVPYSYSSLVVFYVKENNEIEFQELHNVMASSCGCL